MCSLRATLYIIYIYIYQTMILNTISWVVFLSHQGFLPVFGPGFGSVHLHFVQNAQCFPSFVRILLPSAGRNHSGLELGENPQVPKFHLGKGSQNLDMKIDQKPFTTLIKPVQFSS